MMTLAIVLAVIFFFAAIIFLGREKHFLLGWAFMSLAIGMSFLARNFYLLGNKRSDSDVVWAASFFFLLAIIFIVIESLSKKKHPVAN
jgi:hypothetical protein